MFSIYYF
ncbi:hypothetical protein BIW11_06576 [Tropilaelaps mercedesae]|nr:hypothetical protein BIW11_06576 [Tropilaelaps mercedesae]